MRADIFPIPQVSNLTFNSQTMGTLTVEALGIACEGSFEFVEPTPDTTPPSLVSVVVEDTGDQITLTFDEDVYITRNPVDGFDDPFSITADGQPVSRTGRVTLGNSIAFAGLSPVITSGQTVTVSYADPTPGDDEHGLHDRGRKRRGLVHPERRQQLHGRVGSGSGVAGGRRRPGSVCCWSALAAGCGVVARIVTGPHDAHRQDPHLSRRYDTGRPRAVIRLRISQPRTTSLPCPAGLRARRPSPIMDLYRKNVFSTRP